jgi:truncated hemoglobin YjbI
MLGHAGLRAAIEALGPLPLEDLLHEFYQNQARDLLIGFFFTGRDLRSIASRQAAFLRKAAGLALTYEGKSPAKAHGALPPILPGHFDRRLRILETTLSAAGLDLHHVKTWIAFERSFRDAILTG